MAAQSTRRDIELALSVTTANADSLRTLRDSVKDLAKEGGAAAPEFERLAAELDNLSKQAQQLKGLEALTQDLQGAKLAQESFAATSKRLREEVTLLGNSTEAARDKQRTLRAEMDTARLAAQSASDGIKALRLETAQSDRGTLAYTSRLKELNAEYLKQRTTVRETRAALDEATNSVRLASAEQAKAGQAYREANAETQRSTRLLDQMRLGYDALTTKLLESGAATTDVAQAVKNVQDAYTQAQRSLTAYVDQQERAAQASRDAAREESRLASIQEGTRKSLAAQARAEADGIVRDYARMEQAQREAAQAAEAAASRINNALRATGAGAARDLEAQIHEVRAAMDFLRTSGTLTGQALDRAMLQGSNRIKALERELRDATGQLTLMDRASNVLHSTLGRLGAFVGLVEVVQRTATAFMESNKQIEAMRLGLTSIYGSTQIAASQIEFLRATADRAGVAVGDISATFIKFAASTKESNIPLAQSNELFSELTRVSGVLGLSSVKVNQALEAISQIAAKGTLSLEELRQQLGDALPAATALAAKGLGLTQAELFKMVEAGQISAQEFIPAFTTALKTIAGETNTLTAVLGRMRNAITEALQALGDTGAVDALKSGIEGLTTVVRFLGDNMQVVSGVAIGLGQALLTIKFVEFLRGLAGVATGSRAATVALATQTVAVETNAVANAANTATLAANTQAQVANATAKRANAAATGASTVATVAASAAGGLFVGGLNLLTGAFAGLRVAAGTVFRLLGGFPGLLLTVIFSYKELGTWIGESIAKMTGAGAAMKAYEASVLSEAEAYKNAAAEKEAASMRAEQALRRSGAESEKARKLIQDEVATTVKATEAAKARVEVQDRLAAAYVDEAMKLRDSAAAAGVFLAVTQQEAQRKQDLVVALEREVAARQLSINASTTVSQKMRDEQAELVNLLAKKQEEAAQALDASRQAQIEAADRKMLSETYKDNSANVGAYREAMSLAQASVAMLFDTEGNLIGTEQQLFNARMKLRDATTLYNDATEDATRKVKASADSKQAELQLSRAGLQVRLEEARRSEAMAVALGNERAAILAKIEQKRIEQQIAVQAIQMQRLEAQAVLDNVQAQMRELTMRGALTAEKKLELETTILLQRAKLEELRARGVATQALETEISALHRNLAAVNSNNAASGNVPGVKGREASSRMANVGAIQAEINKLDELNTRYGRAGRGASSAAPGSDPNNYDPGSGSPYARPSDKAPTNGNGMTQAEFQRAQKLNGQNAVDNTLSFNLRDKLRNGTLTAADVPDLQNVIAALDQNEQINRDVDRMSPGAFSLTGQADRVEWRNVRQQFAQAISQLSGGGDGTGVGATGSGNVGASRMVVEIKTGRTSRRVNTDSDGAKNIAELMRELEADAGRAA
jgi:tape measure domain-containing protein